MGLAPFAAVAEGAVEEHESLVTMQLWVYPTIAFALLLVALIVVTRLHLDR